jgi:hypothetical protein
MKSLPEKEFWKAVSSRLDQYSEEPSPDDWDKVRFALNAKPSRSIAVNRSSDVLALILLAFLLGFQVARFSDQSRMASIASIRRENSTSEDSRAALNDQDKTPLPDKSIALKKNPVQQNKSSYSTEEQVKATSQQIIETQSQSNLEALPMENSKSTNSSSYLSAQQKNQATAERNTADANAAAQPIEDDSKTAILSTQRDNLISVASTLDSMTMSDQSALNSSATSKHNDTQIRTTAIDRAGVDESSVLASDSTTIVSSSKQTLLSQQGKAEQKKTTIRKFYPKVFVQFNPMMGYNKIIPIKNDEISIERLNSPGILSGNRFAFSTEVGLQLPVARSLEVYASVGYHTQQSNISYDYISGDKLNVNATQKPLSFEITPMPETKNYSLTMHHKSFSAGAMYLLKGTRLQHKIGGGVFYMTGNQSIRETDSYNYLKTQYFGYQLHYRLEYMVTPRMGLYIQPQFRHTLSSPRITGLPFATKPYWAGIGFGLTFRF